jgi:hypothetical protein
MLPNGKSCHPSRINWPLLQYQYCLETYCPFKEENTGSLKGKKSLLSKSSSIPKFSCPTLAYLCKVNHRYTPMREKSAPSYHNFPKKSVRNAPRTMSRRQGTVECPSCHTWFKGRRGLTIHQQRNYPACQPSRQIHQRAALPVLGNSRETNNDNR